MPDSSAPCRPRKSSSSACSRETNLPSSDRKTSSGAEGGASPAGEAGRGGDGGDGREGRWVALTHAVEVPEGGRYDWREVSLEVLTDVGLPGLGEVDLRLQLRGAARLAEITVGR